MPPSPRAKSGRNTRRVIKGHVLLDERTEKRLRRLRWRRIGGVLGVVAAAGGLLALYWSPLLRVQDVRVLGTVNVNAEEVARLANLDGASMLHPPLDRAEERIGELVPVKSVRVERSWPQSVRIRVEERLPWGYWSIGDASYVVDGEGVVLPGGQPPEGAPAIKDMGGPARLIPGDRVDVDAVFLARLLLQRVPETLKLGVAGLEYTPQAGLSIITDTGYRVVLGDSQNADYKLAVWQAVEQRLGRDAMAGHVLDLRFGERPSFQ